MFIKIKVFFKRYLIFLYNPIHDILFPVYERFYRRKKLLKFEDSHLYNFSYTGVNFKIWLDKKNGFVDEEIFANGVYEPEILELYKQYIKAGDVYVDIGTNIGQHSLFASYLVGHSGKVICFEPIKSIFSQLEKSKNENSFKNMTLVNKAIGEKNEKIKIFKNKNNMGASSIVLQKGDFVEEIEISNGGEMEDLEKINFIKIDTEGYETVVVKAIKKYIEKHRPIMLIEYTPNLYGESVENKIEILKILENLEYTILDLEDGNKKLVDMEKWFSNFKKEQTNIFCISK